MHDDRFQGAFTMSKANSTNSPQSSKPERPDGSPLFWHASGRWAKKIKGRFVYFGRGSHAAALELYNQQRDELQSGRSSRDDSSVLTVHGLFAKFLAAKLAKRDNKDLSPRTWAEYASLCRTMIKVFGRHNIAANLTPEDFGRLRVVLAKTRGPEKLKGDIFRCRVPFNWAVEMEHLKQPLKFGPEFEAPNQKTLRAHRKARGPKSFEPDEVGKLLAAAGQPMKAMILLGINCGYGNNDVAALPFTDLDLDDGWVSFARPKTGIDRRCPLWSETVDALREAIGQRPKPKDPADANLVFVTKYGQAFVRGYIGKKNTAVVVNGITQEFSKLLKRTGIGAGRGFYALRHTFQTIGDECDDFVAVRTLMGHAFSGDISAVYRERVKDDRLRKVTEHIRGWLFAKPDDGKGAKTERPKLRVVG